MQLSLLFAFAVMGILIGIAMICEAYYGAANIDKDICPDVLKTTTNMLQFLLGCSAFLICLPILIDLPIYLNDMCVSESVAIISGDNREEWKPRYRCLDIQLQDGTELEVITFSKGINANDDIYVKILPLTKFAEVDNVYAEKKPISYKELAVYAGCILLLVVISKRLHTFKKHSLGTNFNLFGADTSVKGYSNPIIKISASTLIVFETVFFLSYWKDYVSIFQMIFRYLYSFSIVALCITFILYALREISIVREKNNNATKYNS